MKIIWTAILQQEFRRCKWLWIGMIPVVITGMFSDLLEKKVSEIFVALPYVIIIVVPLIFTTGLASLMEKKQMPLHLTLPVSQRRIYWNYYFISLFLCAICVFLLFIRSPLLLKYNPLVMISLFLAVHSTAFYGGTLLRDGTGNLPGLLLCIPLALGILPLVQVILGLDDGWRARRYDDWIPPRQNDFRDEWFLLGFTLFYSILLILEGCRIWCRYQAVERPVFKRTLCFLLILILSAPVLALLTGFTLWGTEQLLYQYWIRQENISKTRAPVLLEYPEIRKEKTEENQSLVTKTQKKEEIAPEEAFRHIQHFLSDPVTLRQTQWIAVPGSINRKYNHDTYIWQDFKTYFYKPFELFIKTRQWEKAEITLNGMQKFYNNVSPPYLGLLEKYMLLSYSAYQMAKYFTPEQDAGYLKLLRRIQMEIRELQYIPLSEILLPDNRFTLLEMDSFTLRPFQRIESRQNSSWISRWVYTRIRHFARYRYIQNSQREEVFFTNHPQKEQLRAFYRKYYATERAYDTLSIEQIWYLLTKLNHSAILQFMEQWLVTGVMPEEWDDWVVAEKNKNGEIILKIKGTTNKIGILLRKEKEK